MQLEQILTAAVRGGASDVILKANALPRFRYNGDIVPLAKGEVVRPEVIMSWIQQMRPQLKNFDDELDMDFAYQSQNGHRFRVNVFKQRGQLAAVLRVVLGHIRSLEELRLPPIVGSLCFEKRGLILVTGATGSGKSTTLAAMLDKINHQRASHIITIEDPIEYLFQDDQSVFEQREVGSDTVSFAKALRAALRQNPDVIMVGELRDRDTVETALQAAETGHLVLATLHTVDAAETLQRVASFFEEEGRPLIRQILASTIVAVVSQRLVPRMDRLGMVAACEILVGNDLVKDAIVRGQNDGLRQIMEDGRSAWGMQTFDQSILHLFKDRLISKDESLKQASRPSDMELLMQGISG
jgi:twitching motility protein PilT